ncbi:MAG: hypothetical protein E7596_06295 [Ruminococcaceae bacterium]|nr:hypothetical protein [Oscillospiraceae bacterium]
MIIFKNKTLNTDKLISFGFKKVGDVYEFATNIVDGQLNVALTVFSNGTLETKVTDNAFGEEYTLHLVESAFGSFVGQVREEYKLLLKEIEESCYETEYIKHSQTREILEGVYEKYKDAPEFPFEEETLVLRRKDNQKWYMIKMSIKPQRLGLEGEDLIEVINVKIDPEELNRVVDDNKYFRAYHMNKKMWATIVLDGRLPTSEILKRIDDSYNLTATKKKGK